MRKAFCFYYGKLFNFSAGKGNVPREYIQCKAADRELHCLPVL